MLWQVFSSQGVLSLSDFCLFELSGLFMVHSHHHHDHGNLCTRHYNRSFAWGVLLNVIYIVIEAVYGLMTGSLALLADAGHNLSDVLGLLLAWSAFYLSNLKPTERHTYGWGASTILAALLNSLILIAALGGICWEAITRFGAPEEVPGMTIIVVASIGVVINTLTALLFMKNRHHDLNIKGAYLHMAADAGVSVAVVLGGLAIYIWQVNWIDPVLSLLIAVIIFIGTWGLLKDSLNLALQAVPKTINLSDVQQSLRTWTTCITFTICMSELAEYDRNSPVGASGSDRREQE
ncbi:MAG: cation diffusion facilitator family transporter [Planctomycetaceae bacterium]